MAIKKSELYSSLWKSCDELRGGMDASQYKDYVLVLLFVKYVSDKYAGQKDALLDVPKGGGFRDMVALKGDKEIGDRINKIIEKLVGANDGIKGIELPDFNDEDKLGKGKEMVDRLSKLVGIFEELDFGRNRAEGDDLLGDAYEYLMRHFATESGKSKGQFYTPAEVSRVMAKVVGVGSARDASQTIHDPTCGSGSLLLRAHDEAKSRAGLDLALYGQEMDQATTALAKMNMILHDCPSAEVWKDNVLANPHFKESNGSLKKFDFTVANPPFSFKAWRSGFNPAEDEFKRFAFGIPPSKRGDLAFILHILTSLKSTGKAAVNLPHGVLFRGSAEADIRRELIRRGYIKGIIGLPPNLFYGTGIPACTIVLDKENAASRKGVFMIDASKGFIKDGNKNRLRAQDIHKIVDVFTRQLEIDKYSRMVPLAEISDPKNDFNLSLPRYIDSTAPEDLQDIDAHLRGGIPNRDVDDLDRHWKVLPSVRSILFKCADRPGYSQLRVAVGEIKVGIFLHEEFTTFNKTITALFEKWKTANTPRLKSIDIDAKPKVLIETLSEDLLETFRRARLLNPYDVYQHLMDYWAETMQDDVYMIANDGWRESAKPRLIIEDKEKKTKEKADFKVGNLKYKAELIPPALIIMRHFAAEALAIEKLESERSELTQQIEEVQEEHSGEGGALEDVCEEGKKTKRADVVGAVIQFEDLAIEECLPKEHAALLAATSHLARAQENLQSCEQESRAFFDPLRSTRGKLTQLKIRGRLKALTGEATQEGQILTAYLKCVDEVSKAYASLNQARVVALKKLSEAEEVQPPAQSIQDLAIVRDFLRLLDEGKAKTDEIKEVQAKLNAAVLRKYETLTEDEIKILVVDDKWLASLSIAVQSELDRVSQALTGRIRQLAERYATPLPQLTGEVATLAARVDEHLKKMGTVWK